MEHDAQDQYSERAGDRLYYSVKIGIPVIVQDQAQTGMSRWESLVGAEDGSEGFIGQ